MADISKIKIESGIYDIKDEMAREKLEKLEKCVKYFDTVAELKNATNLFNGDFVMTKGYYSANDGGAGKYLITNVDNTANEMDKLTLQNQLFATLIIEVPLNIKQVGAKGDGVQDDTAFINRALYAASSIYVPSGTYLVTDTISFENKNIYGDNHTHCMIKGEITDSKKPILAVGGESTIENISAGYDKSIVTTSLTDKVVVRLYGGYRDLVFQKGTIRNCQFVNCGTAITDGGKSVFSATFDTIVIKNIGRYGVYMTSTARTGNIYSNIYISNIDLVSKGNLDPVQIVAGFYLEGEESETTIEQLNVEHLTAWQAIYLKNVHGLFASAIHLEGVMSRQTYFPFVQIDATYGVIQNISFYYTRHLNGQSLIRLGATQSGNTTTNFYGGEKVLTIENLECKGLNRPDRNIFGYEPAYPVANSTISSNSSTTGFSFITRETANDKYKVKLNSYNWQTFSYQWNDSEQYKAFKNNLHGSIEWLNLGAHSRYYSTANRPTSMQFTGMEIFDTTLKKPIYWDGSKWVDATGKAV